MSPTDVQAPGHGEKRQLMLAPATPVARWAYAAAASTMLILAAALWRAGIPQACCASWWRGARNVLLLLCFGGIACYMVAFVLAAWLEEAAESAIVRWGQAADATITWSEQYTGDGLHPYDPCFRGAYSYRPADGPPRHGRFRGYTYDPMDIGWAGDSIYRIQDCYTVGRRHRVVYLPRLPRAHVFQFDRAVGRHPDPPEADSA